MIGLTGLTLVINIKVVYYWRGKSTEKKLTIHSWLVSRKIRCPGYCSMYWKWWVDWGWSRTMFNGIRVETLSFLHNFWPTVDNFITIVEDKSSNTRTKAILVECVWIIQHLNLCFDFFQQLWWPIWSAHDFIFSSQNFILQKAFRRPFQCLFLLEEIPLKLEWNFPLCVFAPHNEV